MGTLGTFRSYFGQSNKFMTFNQPPFHKKYPYPSGGGGADYDFLNEIGLSPPNFLTFRLPWYPEVHETDEEIVATGRFARGRLALFS